MSVDSQRFGRQIILPEIGAEGQARLQRASCLVIGVGGLGSPAALYLAAAGIGRLGLVDFDTVDISNLHRQILYRTSDVGRPKVECAQERLLEYHPNVKIETYATRFTAGIARDLVSKYDVILDGSDNFSTRYLVNDACVLGSRPLVYGSVYRFEGQVSVFSTKSGPCYRCLYPTPPPPDAVPNCAEAGVLGVLPGTLALLQATEALKLCGKFGESLAGHLLTFDAKTSDFRKFKVAKNPECPICSVHPTITALAEENVDCAVENEPFDLTPQAAQESLKSTNPPFLLDVREPEEFKIASLGGQLIPLGELSSRLEELPRNRKLIVLCHHGMRSAQAVAYLRSAGFRAQNLRGGIDRWSNEVDPTIPRY